MMINLRSKSSLVPECPPQDEKGNEHVPTPRAAPGEKRFPIAPDTRKAVEQAHRQLGHPSRQTLVRMLPLSGASDGAIGHAKTWRCDVCAAKAPPKQSQTPIRGCAGIASIRLQ